MARPVSATGPRRRSSIGAPRSQRACCMTPSPAPQKASASAALRNTGRRRNTIAGMRAAAVAARPSHQGGSTVGVK